MYLKDNMFMKRALKLAERGRGRVSPNPMVGTVLVRNGKIIAEGWHKHFGGPHAEVAALSGTNAKNADLYVTLEPCCHTNKKTPPCVPEIIRAGVKRVVVAMKDPNPLVSGRGIRGLRKAGIKVEVGCLQKEAEKLNEAYVKWITTGLPFVAMKVAMSLDGKIATRTGDSKWITSEKSRAYVRVLRDKYDAILVGKNTVMKDNPKLAGKTREPLRVILDSGLELPLSSHVFRDSNVLVLATDRAPKKRLEQYTRAGVEVAILPSTHRRGGASPLQNGTRDAVRRGIFLGARGVSSIFVEGGSEVFGSFVDAKAIDKLYWFIAPKIIGGVNAKPAVSGLGITKLAEALELKGYSVRQLGCDVMIEGYLCT